MTRILVNGVVPFDSGKTTFSLRLLDLLEGIGIKAFPFKPIAGHNLWYSENTIEESLRLGLLIGNDASKYTKRTGLDPSLINPVAVASVPVDLDKMSFDFTEYEKLTLDGPSFLLLRESEFKGEEVVHRYFLNREVQKLSVSSLSEKIEALISSFKPKDVDDMVDRLLKNHENVSEFFSRVSELKRPDVTVIESYNDALSPMRMDSIDATFMISPGKAFLVDGERLIKIMKVINSPPWVVRTGSVIKYLKNYVIKSFNLPLREEVLDFLFRK